MKVLIDTSAWIDHFKGESASVTDILLDDTITILTHTMVIVELLLGGIKRDSAAMKNIRTQSSAAEVSTKELLCFIEENKVVRKGVGYVDCNLLAACLLNSAALLSMDKKLVLLAKELGITTITNKG